MNAIMDRMEPVSNLVAHSVARLREAILQGELAQGERLSEPKLAAQLQLSRAPLREAMRTLTAQGLIRTLPSRGTFVVRSNPELCAEAFALRRSLEAQAVLRRLRRPELFRLDLDRALAAMSEAAAAGDQPALMKAHSQFHGCAYQARGAQLLPDVWSRISDIQRLYFQVFTLTEREAQEFVERHAALADAMFAASSDEVCHLVNDHLHRSEQLLPYPYGEAPAAGRAPGDPRAKRILDEATPPTGRIARQRKTS